MEQRLNRQAYKMKTPVTAIFDIGKTNKKFFLFDAQLKEISHQYKSFDEIPDEDGFLSEDLDSLVKWMRQCVHDLIIEGKYQLEKLNFSTYGASMVHLDANGNLVVPFYNYLKPFPEGLLNDFLKRQGITKFSAATASPILGMLNSGFQLLYLKHEKPEAYKKIKYSLHFPQYLSYLFTGKLVSEFTSIGCHTGLWDFNNQQYHNWLSEEGSEKLLPKIVNSDTVYNVLLEGENVKIGVGVHDSSSAFIPYINTIKEPFALISTGTWSICMNYYNQASLTSRELENDCLNFLSKSGTSVKASRLFMGNEFDFQIQQMADHYNIEPDFYKKISYDSSLTWPNLDDGLLNYHIKSLKPERFGFENKLETDYSIFEDYQSAYHALINDLTKLQIASLSLALGSSQVNSIYIDGGFSANEVFIQQMSNKLSDKKIYTSSFALGTALGAAMLVNGGELPTDFLENNYNIKHHPSLN